MTATQFCIARAAVQLQKKRRHDGLTDQEAEALAVCEERITEYASSAESEPFPEPTGYRPHRKSQAKLPAGELDRRALEDWPAEWGKRT
jgi:hypothetical protein